MTDRQRRLLDMALILIAIVALVLPAQWRAGVQDQRASDQAEQIARNAAVVGQLKELVARLDADEEAFEGKVCRYGNEAKRVDRENDRLIVNGMIEIFRLSPHAAPTVALIEQTILPRLSTDADDHDCNGDGLLTDADYP